MQFKIIGAVLIFAVCSGFGFYIGETYRKDAIYLRHLLYSLDYMSSELQYHLTPLPQLMRQTASQCSNQQLSKIFLLLSQQLEDKYCNDFQHCFDSVLKKYQYSLPKRSENVLYELSRTMGRFDIEGQIHSIMAARAFCLNEYNILSSDISSRLRSYRTLGICTGAAMVILFV